jgi:hypothetical protein
MKNWRLGSRLNRQAGCLPYTRTTSLSKNVCIGFSEFNELNESLNDSLSAKNEALLLANSRI